MIILDVNKVSKNFGYGQLFSDVSFSLNDGESISIVGPNGCGKSTLLKIIAGIEKSDTGSISIKKGASVVYLDQTSSDRVDDRIVKDIIKESFSDLFTIEQKIKRMEYAMSTSIDASEKLLHDYCELIEKFTSIGGYDIDTRLMTICTGLHITDTMLNEVYTNLSGGEKTLVQLAKALLKQPDLILLDEPTNHFDIQRIEWLENYIKEFKGASVIVSHDRYFLDKMSNKILDLSGNVPKVYNTNYTGYINERDRDFEKQMSSYKDQQQTIKRLQEQIKYFSERGMATNSSTLCNRAHALQTKLDKILENKIDRPREEKKLNIDFNKEDKGSKRVIEVKDLTITTPNGRKILDKINLIIKAKEKVTLIGNNGSGKSTFVKTIMGLQDLKIDGEVFVGPSVKIGYLPQIINFDNEKLDLLNYFKELLCIHEQKAREILARFKFGKGDVNKLVKNLSGGERIRVRLACLLEQHVNCLIFDEPTNHIDISTKEVLENAIEDFDGTVIFVSHDRYFINKLAEKCVEFKDGKVRVFEGNYDYYKQQLKNQKV